MIESPVSTSPPPGGTARSAVAGPQPSAPLSRTDGWQLRNWRLRTKLLVVLVVPLLLAGTLGTARVAASVQDADGLEAVAEQVTASQHVARLVDELQGERVLAEGYVAGGRTAGLPALQAQSIQADLAARLVLGVPVGQFGSEAADVATAARVRLGGMQAIRAAVAATAYPAERIDVTYTSVIESLLALQRTALSASDGALLREAGDAIVVAEAKEQVQHQHATLQAVLVAGSATPALREAARASDAQLSAALAELGTTLPTTQARYAATVAGAEVDNRERIEQGVLTALAIDGPLPSSAAEWDAAAGRTAELVRQVEIAQQQQLASDAGASAASARGAAVRDGVIVALLVLLAMALLAIVARSLSRPLRTLRNSAFEIAQRRLPERIEQMAVVDGREPALDVAPVEVDTREEIGEVARAFDAVHAEAVRLAAQQAMLRQSVNDMFANLSRRSQGLVRRQLRLIDELERHEQDPDHLDDLFRLDHLATRMRRNNENLLVLAGELDHRTRSHAAMPAQDVLRAAVSEIEQYQRVRVRRAPEVEVAGAVVADLVHLLAELLENATSFSAPGSPVLLDARIASGGDLNVEITDSGIGLGAAELATINERLADPPVVDVAVSRRMGLFVVGRLAQRHGLGVSLRPGPAGKGLFAFIVVPAGFLEIGKSDVSVAASPRSASVTPSRGLPRAVAAEGSADRQPIAAPPSPAGTATAVHRRPADAPDAIALSASEARLAHDPPDPTVPGPSSSGFHDARFVPALAEELMPSTEAGGGAVRGRRGRMVRWRQGLGDAAPWGSDPGLPEHAADAPVIPGPRSAEAGIEARPRPVGSVPLPPNTAAASPPPLTGKQDRPGVGGDSE